MVEVLVSISSISDAQFPLYSPLKLFDMAKSQGRYLYVSAPMVRYSKVFPLQKTACYCVRDVLNIRNLLKIYLLNHAHTHSLKLAFRQTVHSYGADLTFTPMILSREFNRSPIARSSDLTLSARGGPQQQPPTIVQFGANDATEFARSASLVAPWVNGVDLNCGCPQSWACAESLGAKLIERREVVLSLVRQCRARLREGGFAVELENSKDDGRRGKSVSIKIRIHRDLRDTVDFLDAVIGHPQARNIDFLTIHPRMRWTRSSTPINVEALQFLVEKYGSVLPIMVSGDVFALSTLPYTSSVEPLPTMWTSEGIRPKATSLPTSPPQTGQAIPTKPTAKKPHIPDLAGLMSARALLANPALFAGHDTCPWEVVSLFMRNVARANLPLKLVQHHLNEMLGPGFGPERSAALLGKADRMRMLECGNFLEVVDFLDEISGREGERAVIDRGCGKWM